MDTSDTTLFSMRYSSLPNQYCPLSIGKYKTSSLPASAAFIYFTIYDQSYDALFNKIQHRDRYGPFQDYLLSCQKLEVDFFPLPLLIYRPLSPRVFFTGYF
jgi:hypothetical protein